MIQNKVVFFFLVGFFFAKNSSFSNWINSEKSLFGQYFKAEFEFNNTNSNVTIPIVLYVDSKNKKFRLEAEDRIILSDTTTWKSLLEQSNQIFIQSVTTNERLYFKLLSKEYLVKSFLKEEIKNDFNSFHFYLKEISCFMAIFVDEYNIINHINFEINGNSFNINNLHVSNSFDSSSVFELQEQGFIIFDLRE